MPLSVEEFNLQNPEQSYLTIHVTWFALLDACEVCRDLNLQSWEAPNLTGILTHPMHGPVYDLDADVSLTHANCRCQVEFYPVVDLEKTGIFRYVQNLMEDKKQGMPSNIDDATKKVETLRVEVAHTAGTLRELEYVFYRLTSTMKRMGLPPEVAGAVSLLQRAILTARILHTTITFLEMSTPLGWVLGILSGLGAAASASDLALSLGE